MHTGVRSYLCQCLVIGCMGLAGLLPRMISAQANAVGTNAAARSLSLAEAVDLALRQSPAIRLAQKDVEATQGVSIQTRAIVIPKLQVTGDFTAVQPSNVDRPEIDIPGFTFGSDKSWRTQVKLVQSVYEGGRLASSLRAARLLQQQSALNYQTAVADTLLRVQVAFYDALLAREQIAVQEAEVELLERELADTTRRFNAGTVPRFNVLRAEVELANARPRLIRSRNTFGIAKDDLATLLGLSVAHQGAEDIPLVLAGKLQAEPYPLQLRAALNLALDRRTELAALRKTEALRKEQVATAKAGYLPSLQAFAGYDAHSSIFSSDLTDERHGWMAGAQVTWNLFDGLQTQGRLKEARALQERAGIELEDTARRIELEVRTEFSKLTEAREVMESQIKVVEQAEEALRLARSRQEAGSGTQLDVLGAQTALTEARITQVQSLRDYVVAVARMERATGNSFTRDQ